MTEHVNCKNCGNDTYVLLVEDGLKYLVCEECGNRMPAETWGPTETPPEEYQ
jgi:translation initiation factor 2 beta subunit (eIF-2beta)/eIF-5